MTPLNSVLIVDDEPAVRDIMARWVSSLGLYPRTAATADEALATLSTQHYDMAVIDVMMPGHNGLWLANELKRDHPHTAVVIATGYTGLLAEGGGPPPVADLLIKPFARERFELALDRGRQWRKQALEEVRWHAVLSIELNDRSQEICTRLARQDAAREADVLAALAAARVADVMEHAGRVARFTASVAREMGVVEAIGDLVELAARFHDIGKAAMPDALMSKPSPLTPGEKAIMRRHVSAGAEILESTRTLREIAPVVLATHEWFSGGGYPGKLAGTEIPLAGRIISVVDAYDAMTARRRYGGSFDTAEAVAELLRCQGTQFDPDVVAAFLSVLSRH